MRQGLALEDSTWGPEVGVLFLGIRFLLLAAINHVATLKAMHDDYKQPEETFRNVSCWVDQANLATDLAACLDQFMVAVPGAFGAGFTERLAKETRPANGGVNSAGKGYTCAAVFGSGEAADAKELVAHFDKSFYRVFEGYTCCNDSLPFSVNPPSWMTKR
jgi:hypothetical protein